MSAPRGEKPYRVYRGGRVKGKVPTIPRPTRERGADGEARREYRGPGPKQAVTGWRGWGWERWTGLSILLVVLVLFFWTLSGYLAFRCGVKECNKPMAQALTRASTPGYGITPFHP